MEATEPIVMAPLGEIKQDDFISQLKKETEKDKNPPPAPEPKMYDTKPGSREKSKDAEPDDDGDEDDDLDELSNPALVTDILVEVVDLLHNMAMQAMSGEPDPTLFKVPEQGKKRIKKATAKLIARFNWKLHPGFALVLLVLVVYGPTTVKAAGIRKMKIREKKIKEGELEKSEVEIKRGPGRPPGSTKDKK